MNRISRFLGGLMVGTALTLNGWGAFPVSFEASTGGWQLASPAVGNIDADADLEVVIATRTSNGAWLVDAYNWNGTRLPGFPYNAGTRPINVSPTLVNIDASPANEILFTEANSIVALNGSGAVLWKQTVGSLNYIPSAGFQAVTNGFYLTPLGLFQPLLPATAEFFSEVSPPIVADLEGDGSLEVVTSWKIDPDKLSNAQDYNPLLNDIFGLQEWGATGEVWSGGVVVSDARTGSIEFIYHFHQLVEAGLALAQLDNDPAVEVLVLNDADSVVAFDKTQAPGLFGAGMLHKKFGKNLRLLSGSYQTGVDVHSGDIDGDGLDEVLVASTQINPNWQPSETILDDDGSILWREWKDPVSFQNAHGWLNSATLIPVNPNRDNKVDVLGFTHGHEITFRYWNGVELVSHPGWPKSFAPLVPTPPVVGDVDGDGAEEIVIGTYDPAKSSSNGKLQVFSLAGVEKRAVVVPGGLKHIPAIVDVNNDGDNEVIYRALDGRVYIQNFGGGIERSWAMHRGNAERNGNSAANLYPAGTPVITGRTNAFAEVTFHWRLPAGYSASTVKVLRANNPAGPFTEVANLPGSALEYSDRSITAGVQYIYEVAAVYPNGVVRSAPFSMRAEWSRNLIVNGGFEQDDDRGWDKWFSGDIPWQNMRGSAGQAHTGVRSMEIELENHGNNSSITQYSHYGTPEDYLPVQPGKLYSFGGFMRSSGLNAQTEHWFEWDSSKTAANTNARPGLPWPSYFTPALRPGATATAWTYLNRVFEMPLGFPNVQLRHRYKTDSPATGSVFLDDIFFRELPAPNDSRWKDLIGLGSRWRYLSSTPPANWYAESFDDSMWGDATAKFGQGSGPQNIVTALPKNQPAYYFRRSFTVENPKVEEFLLVAACTDDYASKVYPLRMWLNGQEIVTGGIEAVSGEGNVLKYFDLTPFTHLLRAGNNQVAFQLNNTWQATWDNVAFDVALRVIPTPPNENSTARLERVRRLSNGTIEIGIATSAASSWTLQSSDTFAPATWRNVQMLTFSVAGLQTVLDTGQNGRPAPSLAANRYYRVVRN